MRLFDVNLDPKNTIFLIDGSSFLYRAYYGTRPLHTSKGEPVQAVYSFCRMIKKLIDQFSLQYAALVWDSKGPTIRHQMYGDYKATRQAPPSDLFTQKERIVHFAELIGLHQISEIGYEADDLMFAVAKDMAAQGYKVVLVTADKDMGQTLTDSIFLFDYFKDQLLAKAAFEEKIGFPVEKLPFYFALLGDSSDNIPGVTGIGKKTAQELVTQFDSLEDLYVRIDTITSPRIKNTLLTNKDNAFLSRQLFLLTYVQTGTTLDNLALNAAQWNFARPLFMELEFKSLLQDVVATKEQQQTFIAQKIEDIKKKNFKRITTPLELGAVVAEIEAAQRVAIDTEGDGIDPLTCNLVGISLCTNEQVAYYIPFGHVTGEPQLPYEYVKSALASVLTDTKITKYFHHAKFDLHLLAAKGIEVKGPIFDTMIAASLVTKDWQRIGLKQLALFYFNEHMLTFEEVVKANKFGNFSRVPLELATYYAANDAYQTFKLAQLFKEELIKEGMQELFATIEMPLMYVLYAMETKGIYTDRSILQTLDVQLNLALAEIEQTIKTMVPESQAAINLNSPKQIEQLLFYELKLPPQKKSDKGTGYSTDQEVLEALAKLHPVPALILKYRELFKLQSTYAQSLQEYIHPRDQRIHSTFSQTRVATGRLASFDPNMQNIPASGPGLAIRAAFKPIDGHVFIAADYSQIELRVLAYLSQDVALMKAFADGRDIHRETAARLFDVPFNQVTHDQRQIGKRINFSILYGLTPYGLSKDLDISYAQAKQYIDKYFAQFPGVRQWMDSIIQEVQQKGYVTTYWGRRRYIPAIYEKNRVLYEEAKRIAINTVAQGTAAEIVKLGMLALQEKLHEQGAAMLLQIHDELLIEAPIQKTAAIEKMIKQTLEGITNWNVPLEATIKTGGNWQEVSK